MTRTLCIYHSFMMSTLSITRLIHDTYIVYYTFTLLNLSLSCNSFSCSFLILLSYPAKTLESVQKLCSATGDGGKQAATVINCAPETKKEGVTKNSERDGLLQQAGSRSSQLLLTNCRALSPAEIGAVNVYHL